MYYCSSYQYLSMLFNLSACPGKQLECNAADIIIMKSGTVPSAYSLRFEGNAQRVPSQPQNLIESFALMQNSRSIYEEI